MNSVRFRAIQSRVISGKNTPLDYQRCPMKIMNSTINSNLSRMPLFGKSRHTQSASGRSRDTQERGKSIRSRLALSSILACAVLAFPSPGAIAATAKAQATSAGARQLKSDEIVTRLVGYTVTFVVGAKTFLVHYGKDNVISGKLVDKNWSDTGYYGITNDDSVCLSWRKSDKGRLRCMTVFVVSDVVKKFNPDGTLAGDLVRFQKGKTF